MNLLSFLYVILAFGALASLCIMILRIGRMLGTCPITKSVARTASVTIATGFAAIGAGGVILLGAMIPVMANAPLLGFLLALGLASLCLGLGFTHAIATLRVVIARPLPKAADPEQPDHPLEPAADPPL